MKIISLTFAFTLLLALNFTLQAQQAIIDSLVQVSKTGTDTAKVDALTTLAVAYRTAEPSEALTYCKKALAISKKIKYKSAEGELYNILGSIHTVLGDYPKAAKYLIKSINIYEELGEQQGQANVSNSLGIIYLRQKDYSNALKYYFRALELAEEINNPQKTATFLLNIGEVYQLIGNHKMALDYEWRALKIGKSIQDEETVAYANGIIGQVFAEQEKFEEAIKYQKAALAAFLKVSDLLGAAEYHAHLARTYLKQKKLEHAEDYATWGLEMARDIGSKKWIIENSSLLSKVFRQKGEYQRALEYQDLYIAYKDSLISEENSRQVSQMRILYETESKEQENQLLRKDQILQEEKLKEQRLINWGIGIGLALVMLFSTFLFRANRLVRKVNQKLKSQRNRLAEQTEALQQANEEISEQHDQIQAANRDIRASITYAQRIQTALLPFHERLNEALPEHFILFKPRDIVSGDFYWFAEKEHKHIIAVLDCTGHGIPGAFMSLIGNDLLNEIVNIKNITEPHLILEELRESIIRVLRQEMTHNQDGMDISICTIDSYPPEYYATLGTPKLEFAGAGHPLIYLQDGKLHLIRGNRIIIGGYNKMQREQRFDKHTILLDRPTTFYLYSDGYQDQFGGPRKKKFMTRRLRELLQNIHQEPLKKQQEILEQTIEDWMGDQKQIDDIIVFGARVGNS